MAVVPDPAPLDAMLADIDTLLCDGAGHRATVADLAGGSEWVSPMAERYRAEMAGAHDDLTAAARSITEMAAEVTHVRANLAQRRSELEAVESDCRRRIAAHNARPENAHNPFQTPALSRYDERWDEIEASLRARGG